MERFILTSDHYTGMVQFNFDDSGLMVFYSVLDADLTRAELLGILKKIPIEEADLLKLNATNYFTIKKISEDLSFDNFWREYDKKIHALRCEPFWKKMSDAKKLMALKAVAPYTDYCTRTGVAKANPENYLKKQYYKTDWRNER